MKRISIFFLMIFIHIGIKTYCQSPIYFDYDDSGNRITRSIVLTKNSEESDTSYHEKFIEKINNTVVNIFPIPTKSSLQINLENFDENNPSSIEIIDINGNVIIHINNVAVTNIVDLSTNSPGNYILKIKIDNEIIIRKIIKY